MGLNSVNEESVTVAELIKQLKTLDQTAVVCLSDPPNGLYTIEVIGARSAKYIDLSGNEKYGSVIILH